MYPPFQKFRLRGNFLLLPIFFFFNSFVSENLSNLGSKNRSFPKRTFLRKFFILMENHIFSMKLNIFSKFPIQEKISLKLNFFLNFYLFLWPRKNFGSYGVLKINISYFRLIIPPKFFLFSSLQK